MKIFNSQKFLVIYSGVLTLAVVVSLLSGFGGRGHHRNAHLDTLTVQRINLVEPDGTLRMVLSNNHRLPGIVVHGHEYPDYGNRQATTAAGILFYDAQATESGGLTFGGRKDEQGNISRWGHFSFDRYNQDQMLTISAEDDGTNHASSIRFIDQPNWSIEEYLQLLDRIQDLPPEEQQTQIEAFLETHPPGAGVRTLLSNENYPDAPSSSGTTLRFNDAEGRLRTRYGVDAEGQPAVEFLDESGNIVARYPPN